MSCCGRSDLEMNGRIGKQRYIPTVCYCPCPKRKCCGPPCALSPCCPAPRMILTHRSCRPCCKQSCNNCLPRCPTTPCFPQVCCPLPCSPCQIRWKFLAPPPCIPPPCPRGGSFCCGLSPVCRPCCAPPRSSPSCPSPCPC